MHAALDSAIRDAVAPLVTQEEFEQKVATLVTREELDRKLDEKIAALATKDEVAALGQRLDARIDGGSRALAQCTPRFTTRT